MKKIVLVCMFLSACNTLHVEQELQLQHLKSQNITIETTRFERPASPLIAGGLNILPGVGNLYLASGKEADSNHFMYAIMNLVFYPLSIIWAVPEAAIDAQNINLQVFLKNHSADK